tara:strand:+ start:295 stop:1173 length:879 start_codon:yes stop_codon:yes gene_type:complete
MLPIGRHYFGGTNVFKMLVAGIFAFVAVSSVTAAPSTARLNKYLTDEERQLCSSDEGILQLSLISSPEERAREEEEIRKPEEAYQNYLLGPTVATLRKLGRSILPPPVKLDLAKERNHLARTYCFNDVKNRFRYFTPDWTLLNYTTDQSAVLQDTTFEYPRAAACIADGETQRCDKSFITSLPPGYQLCEVKGGPTKEAGWYPTFLRYSAKIANTNPGDGPSPRATAVRITSKGRSRNNQPIRMYIGLKIRAVAIEFDNETRFRMGCRMYQESEVILQGDRPLPGHEIDLRR